MSYCMPTHLKIEQVIGAGVGVRVGCGFRNLCADVTKGNLP